VDRETLPAFSTTYPTATAGEIGVTVFEPVGGGSHLVVGLDIDVRALIRGVAEIPSSDQRGAFTMLVGSSAELLGGGDAAPMTLGIRGDWVGAHLGSASPVMQNGLGGVLATGTAQTVQVKLGGADQVLFTSPIPLAHWVLVSAVPRGGLLPDQASLTRGIDNGIHHVIRQAIPLAIGLSVVAFLLATLLARRLVGPVRSLTVAAQRLGSGNTEEPVPPTGDDEVGLLAESLERMRQEINASRDAILGAARELEGRVASRTAELRARNEELLALNALAGSLTHSLDPEAILAGALDALQAILPVRAARAYLYESGRLRLLVDKAPQAAVAGLGDRLAQAASSSVDGRDLVMRPTGGGVLLALPVGTTDGAIGAIALLLREGWRLAGRSRALLRAIADQSGLALRTAALSAEGRELAVLEERTRLAREIHDTIAQQLTAVVLQLEAADALVERDQGRARSAVVEARDMARSALQEARRSVWNLRPATLAAGGLAAALGLEASRLEQRSGIAIRLRTDRLPHDFSVAPATEVAFFRIAQEALNNAVQHSHAHAVTVYLRLERDELVLGVEDDGDGFDPKAWQRGSFGLVGMAERARLVGAQFAVESSPAGGTRVEVRLAGAVAAAQAATA
jgi:signal transduction histidine kinase/HAMP domain-containing protein